MSIRPKFAHKIPKFGHFYLSLATWIKAYLLSQVGVQHDKFCIDFV